MAVKELLNKISDLNVLVIGDIMLDHYIIGDAMRISPEAPVPVVAVERDKYALGAAANVALNAVQLGSAVEVIGKIGIDLSGQKIKTLFSSAGIMFDDSLEDDAVATITKTRVVVRGQQLCRIDRENKKREYCIIDDSQVSQICEKIKTADVVILSDYAKGAFFEANIKKFIDAANSAKTFVAVDPKPANKLQFSDISLMTPNKTEAAQLADVELEEYAEFPQELIFKKISEKFSPKNLIITMGAEGMLVLGSDKKLLRIPTYAQEVFDVSGAGDTSIVCLALALAAGESLIRAAKFANIAAGIVVARHGTAAISADDMLNSSSADLLNL